MLRGVSVLSLFGAIGVFTNAAHECTFAFVSVCLFVSFYTSFLCTISHILQAHNFLSPRMQDHGLGAVVLDAGAGRGAVLHWLEDVQQYTPIKGAHGIELSQVQN